MKVSEGEEEPMSALCKFDNRYCTGHLQQLRSTSCCFCISSLRLSIPLCSALPDRFPSDTAQLLVPVLPVPRDNFRQWLPTNLLGDNRSETTEEVSFAVNDDRLAGEGHLEGPFLV